jgi:hypothetical protein
MQKLESIFSRRQNLTFDFFISFRYIECITKSTAIKLLPKHLLIELENEKMFQQNIKKGAGDKQLGVKLGDIKKLAKRIKRDHKLVGISLPYAL